MKKTYEPATIEIIEIQVQDIIRTSAVGTGDHSSPFDSEEQPFSFISNLDLEIPLPH